MSQEGLDKLLQGVGGLTEELRGFLNKLLSPVADEAGQLFADQIRFWRFKRWVVIAERSRVLLESRNITPQAIPPRLLFPLLEAASQEDDDDLTDRWAKLLAAYASGQPGKKAYAEILSGLDPVDAKALDIIYKFQVAHPTMPGELQNGYEIDALSEDLALSRNETERVLENLQRLKVVQPIYIPTMAYPTFPIKLYDDRPVCLTSLGLEFMRLCGLES